MRHNKTLYLIGLITLIGMACGGVGDLFGGSAPGSSADSAIPVGESITYEWGAVQVLSFHRPTALVIVPADTNSVDQRAAHPATGAEFVAIEMQFTCATTQTTCNEPPQAEMELVLTDGRVVTEDFFPWDLVWLGDEAVAGGSTVSGWVTFEVPIDAEVQSIKLLPYDGTDEFHGALPAPVDGYSIEMPWQTYDDGSEEQELPALRRDLENAGFDILWSGLYRSGGETGMYVTTYTDKVVFIEDSEAVQEAQAALLATLDVWGTYGNGVNYVGIELFNGVSDDVIATVGAEVADIEAYLNGSSDLNTFMGTWWVATD